MLIILFSKKSHAVITKAFLTTDHFNINYNIKNIDCAKISAAKLEFCCDKITSFLQMDPLDKVNFSLSSEKEKTIFESTNYKISNNIFLSTDNNFSLLENDVYKKIFKIYLKKIMPDGRGTTIINKNFIDAIIEYSLIEPEFIEIILNDLQNNLQIFLIDFNTISQYNDDTQRDIYIAFINFIISNYNKKILIQCLKDSNYYNGFYESLSKITGDSIYKITENFNTFLKLHKSDKYGKNDNEKQLLHEIDEFTDISYSVFGNEQEAVLQQNDILFRLLLNINEKETTVILKHTEKGSCFSKLVFINKDLLAIVEILKSGSTINIYDIERHIFLTNAVLPYLFISEINPINNSSLIFSASCGQTSDLYTYDYNSRKFGVLTESGYNYFPVILKEKVYCITGNYINSIVELDIKSGVIKNIFSSDQKICDLKQINDKFFVFSMKINGFNNLFSFEIQSGKLRQITKDHSSNRAPQIRDNRIYFFSFYKNKYQIFFKPYSQGDF